MTPERQKMTNDLILILRLRRGLRQFDLAHSLGISEATLSRKENGLLKWTDAEVLQLESIFEYPVREALYLPWPDLPTSFLSGKEVTT